MLKQSLLLTLIASLALAGCSSNPISSTPTAVALLTTATLASTVVQTNAPTNAPTETPTLTQTATATLTLTPTSTNTPTLTRTLPPSEVVLRDSFDAPCKISSGEDAVGKWGCKYGEDVLSLTQANYNIHQTYPSLHLRDFILEADARVVSTDILTFGYGFVFRVTADGFWVFDVGKNSFYALAYHDNKGKATNYLVANAPISAVRPEGNHLEVVAQGNQIAIYVNNMWINTTTDPDPNYGSVGFYLGSNYANTKVAFDNLVVTQLNTPISIPAPISVPVSTPNTARANPSPTFPPPTQANQYPLPAGKGGLIVRNFYGQDMTFTINNKQYTIAGNGEVFIVLDPGTYPWSAFIPGKGQAHGSAIVKPDENFVQYFSSQ